MAADFTTSICVDALDMAAVGVGIGFTGADIVTLTLYILFAGSLVPLFFSVILGPGAFLVDGLLFWGGVLVMVVIGFGVKAWVWDQTCPPILGMSSSFG